MKTSNYRDEKTLGELQGALRALRQANPNNNSEISKCYDVTILEMEKTVAYFKVWVVEAGPARAE